MSRCPPHPEDRIELRKKPRVGGGSVFIHQCLACGDVVGRVPLERVPDPRIVKHFDSRLYHQPQLTARRREFVARFKRADWKRLRLLVLERDHYTCRGCQDMATEVHHLTYERFGAELLTDLAASCFDCNQREREQRITAHVLGLEAMKELP